MEHAHWITERTWYVKHTCAKCKFCTKYDFDLCGDRRINIKKFNYCPHCGAKMDEMDKEGEK